MAANTRYPQGGLARFTRSTMPLNRKEWPRDQQTWIDNS
jgi:hypothetical protein